MNKDNTFKTKTGYCHVLADKIVLSRDGIIGNLAQATHGDHIRQTLQLYIVLALSAFYFAFSASQKGHLMIPVFLSVLGCFLLYAVFSGWNNSASPVIQRDQIKSVELKKAVLGLIRSRFEISFKNEAGNIKKRLIILPCSSTNGKSEADKAIQIMEREKLLNTNDMIR